MNDFEPKNPFIPNSRKNIYAVRAANILFGGKRVKLIALVMTFFLGLVILVPQVHATLYETTFTLKEKGEPFWTTTLSVETTTSNTTTRVPIGFYDVITLLFATDTFITPFNLTLPINNSTLEVTSVPSGLTIIFQPMAPGDVNGDKIVDIYDLVLVIEYFGSYSLFYDLYFDFTFEVDIYDLVIIAINFGREY